MHPWENNFDNHPIHGTLENLTEKVKEAYSGKLNPEDAKGVERLRTASDHIRNRLSSVQKLLVDKSILDEIDRNLSTTLSKLNSFVDNKDVEHLQYANYSIDDAMTQIRALPITVLETDSKSILREAETYKKRATEYLETVKRQADALKENISNIEKESESEKGRIQEITDSLNQLRLNIENFSTEFQNQFSSSEDRRRQDFESLLSESKLTFDEWQKGLSGSWSAFEEKIEAGHKDLTGRGEAVITKLEELKEEASNLVGVIGNTGLTGGYKKIADDERKAANWWRRIALVFMGTSVIFLACTLWFTSAESLDWEIAILRIFAAFLIGLPGSYAAFESAKHRKEERRNRHIEQELAAIDPYLESFGDEKKEELKEKLASNVFGKMKNGDDDQHLSVPLDALVKTLSEWIKKQITNK